MNNHTTATTPRPSASRGCHRWIAIGIVASAALTACEFSSTSTKYEYTCPKDINGEATSLAEMDFLDLSATGRSESVLAERLNALQVELERVADCEGHATVIAFSNSSAAHTILLDRGFTDDGATETARDLNIPAVIDDAMTEIRNNADLALDQLPPDGTDVNAMFVLAADQVAGSDPNSAIEIYGFTDGITTTGAVNVNDPELTPDRAIELADGSLQVDLRRITHVDIRGIGKVAGDTQPPTDYVAAVAAYVTELCNNATGDTTGHKCIVRTITVPR